VRDPVRCSWGINALRKEERLTSVGGRKKGLGGEKREMAKKERVYRDKDGTATTSATIPCKEGTKEGGQDLKRKALAVVAVTGEEEARKVERKAAAFEKRARSVWPSRRGGRCR